MTCRDERGMATAEYTVGTLGAVCIGLVLYKLGALDHDNPWFESFREMLVEALGWRPIGFRTSCRDWDLRAVTPAARLGHGHGRAGDDRAVRRGLRVPAAVGRLARPHPGTTG